jgi:threonine aldolase
MDAALRGAGAHYYEWDEASLGSHQRLAPDETLVRLVCSFQTDEAAVDSFLGIARQAGSGVV